ncbi:MAG: hypothetical protein QHH06_12040 [Clostridiales bacterium]|jgi:hypothetical protein|nr:hypothetical protein [Eubacteriales bacterium]MDH7567183.1 hypothetical protein [Clostridiales bacterium]
MVKVHPQFKDIPFHTMSPGEALEHLQSDKNGLTDEEKTAFSQRALS